MYRDTEQSYGEFTLDVYEAPGGWQVDWWKRSRPDVCGKVNLPKRKEAIREAKRRIDLREVSR